MVNNSDLVEMLGIRAPPNLANFCNLGFEVKDLVSTHNSLKGTRASLSRSS